MEKPARAVVYHGWYAGAHVSLCFPDRRGVLMGVTPGFILKGGAGSMRDRFGGCLQIFISTFIS